MLKQDRSIVFDKVVDEIMSFPPPYESVGWPIGLEHFIRDLVIRSANATINSVYSEKELEEKAETILLDSSTDSIK